MRRSRGIFFAIVLCVGLLPSPVAAGDSRFFPETGQTSSNAFYQFWLTHGQTEALGLPISPTFVAGGIDFYEAPIVVQFYERALFEWHPENPPGERVQLTRVAVKRLDGYVAEYQAESPGSGDIRTAPPRPCTAGANCETFAATHHTVQGAIRDYWGTHGGSAVLGYPLTEEFTTTVDSGESIVVQFFERAILELHPRNGGSIQLQRVGAYLWDYYKDNVLGHPETFPVVTVPDSDSNAPYLPGA